MAAAQEDLTHHGHMLRSCLGCLPCLPPPARALACLGSPTCAWQTPASPWAWHLDDGSTWLGPVVTCHSSSSSPGPRSSRPAAARFIFPSLPRPGTGSSLHPPGF